MLRETSYPFFIVNIGRPKQLGYNVDEQAGTKFPCELRLRPSMTRSSAGKPWIVVIPTFIYLI